MSPWPSIILIALLSFCRWMGKGRVFRFLIGITDFCVFGRNRQICNLQYGFIITQSLFTSDKIVQISRPHKDRDVIRRLDTFSWFR